MPAADATRASAEERIALELGLAESEAEAAAANPMGIVGEETTAGAVGEAPPASAADPIGIVAPDDHGMPSLHMQDPIMEPPLIPMANIWRIRRTEIRNRRVPRLA